MLHVDLSMARRSGIAEQSLEAVVHVLLQMTVKEGETRLICCKVDHCAAVVGHYDRVLDNSSRLFPVNLHQFPKVPMKMHGMRVVGTVAHHQTIANSCL